ncbi:MAG: hypothetical protein COU22_02370 [Candidatus Komeilibacteria bacterium CG10_big_fil_rev_8_21_14_0_10_41_13]|uniref:DUF4468 domain-containing protein n=1 Tax=Candidatus Komeilibacteria bacterium CG10_big_fil_rev_8_21_14_0_10_41_13 TaxID=1974476 RepID=A0A2M6WC85_9BACT|nr:MAG: hypothetical protein COU22_02370 [Candidatus Komeilibacteria bacterium CG10_big_fil_rev_8_21_14_0_10_41_13]
MKLSVILISFILSFSVAQAAEIGEVIVEVPAGYYQHEPKIIYRIQRGVCVIGGEWLGSGIGENVFQYSVKTPAKNYRVLMYDRYRQEYPNGKFLVERTVKISDDHNGSDSRGYGLTLIFVENNSGFLENSDLYISPIRSLNMDVYYYQRFGDQITDDNYPAEAGQLRQLYSLIKLIKDDIESAHNLPDNTDFYNRWSGMLKQKINSFTRK